MYDRLIFRGAATALITPLNASGVDYDRFGRVIDWQIEQGINALVIAGTTGEGSTLTDEEHRAVVKYSVERVAGRVPVIAGTGSNDTAYAIELSRYAQAVGVNAVLLVTPYYNKCTQLGLVAHYTKIADAINVPAILYNVPPRTGVDIKPETYAKLSKHPNIVAAKEANGDLTSILRTRKLCGDDLAIYSGNDDQTIPILSLGGSGVISVLSNVAPRDTHLICQNYFDGKTDEASRMQIDYCDLIDALFCEVNPIPVKVAMRLLGWNVGELRMPLCEPEPVHVEQIKSALMAHGLLK